MRRRLSLLLVLVLLLGCFPVEVFAGKSLWGSSDGGYPSITIRKPTGTSKYDPSNVQHGYYEEWAGSRCYSAIRMRAVPLDESRADPGRQDYFIADYPFNTPNGQAWMLEHQELINAPGYFDDNWKVFSNTQTGYSWTMVQAFEEGVLTYQMHPLTARYDSEIKAFLEACGCPEKLGVDITTSAGLDSVLHCDALENDDDDHTQRKKLASYFGLSGQDAESFYIVVEQFPVLRNFMFGQRTVADEGDTGLGLVYIDDVTVAGVNIGKQMEWYVGESLATYNISDPKVNDRPVLAFGATPDTAAESMRRIGYNNAVSRYITRGYGRLYWHQGEEAFFPGYTVVNALNDEVNGYSIYSFMEISQAKVGGNVAVEYDGDVNTSNPGEFKSTGSLINKGSTTSLAYWDFAQNKFVDSADNATLLKFAGKIDMTDEYALCFTGISDHNISDDVKLEPSLRSSFEDAPGQGYTTSSLSWGSPRATGGEYNVGYVWKVTALDGYRNVVPIINRFQNAFNAVSIGGSLSVGAKTANTTPTYEQYPVLDGSFANAREGMSLSTPGVLEKGLDGKYTFKKDEKLGMGYEFIIRGTPVHSREITVLVEGNEDGTVDSVSSSQTWEEDYTTAKNTIHSVTEVPDYTFVGWLVVPYQDDSVTTSIESRLSSAHCDIDSLFNAAKSGAPTLVESNGSPSTIGIGSTLTDQPPEGYTVYKIAYAGPPIPQPPGEVVLPAYMLNRYFNNIIQTSSQLAGHPQKYTLAKDWTWVNWYGPLYCDETGALIGYSSYKDDWVIEYWDAAGGGEFALDNAKLDYYYPKGTGNWSSSVRSKLTHAWQENMDTRYMSETANVVDYAFNLIRANDDFADKRSVSGISYQNYVGGTGDSQDLLRIKSSFGVVPAVVKRASPARSSLAVLKTYSEEFNIKSRFQHTGSATGQHVHPKSSHSHIWYCGGCRGNSEDGYWCPGHLCSFMYWNDEHLYNVTCMGFRSISGAKLNTIDYSFKASALKYTTKDDLGVGQNDFLGGSNSKPLSAGKRNSTAGSITDSNFYRFTTVRYTGVDLKFHPENLMVFKIGTTDFATTSGMQYSPVNVMSEVKRTSASSGMYFFRLNANITSVPGTVYSDSMQGGTGMMGFGGSVSIPAGADVTIAADPTGVSVDLYGYDLDLVQTLDDGKLGAVGENRAYNTVVRSGLDAYQQWGNSNSHDSILRHFNSWCDDILKVENYAADFKLFVNNGLKSENFSATVGHVDRGAAGTVEEGVYQLVVRKGILRTGEGDYTKMIRQMATDYGCSTSEAEAMFQESKIYTAIINGMETCLNPKNNSKDVISGCPDSLGDIQSRWTNELGGNGNWYDETSQTFVVRRFTNLGNKLCDVIAEDKIDYQLAPTAGTNTGEGAYSNLSYNARWELNIFFDQDHASQVNDLLLGSATYYDPQNGSAGFDPSNSAYSVLFNSIPVDGADFVIPASSTQDFRN